MSDPARDFLKALSAEEQLLLDQGSDDQLGVGLLTAIKEFDYYHYNLVRHAPDDEAAHHFQLLRLGLPRLVASVLRAVPKFRYPTLTFQSDRALIHAALDQTAAFGFVEEGKRLGQAALAGECEIAVAGDRVFDVVLPATVFNMEQHEALVEEHYARTSREQMRSAAAAEFERTGALAHIEALTRDSVYVFEKHYIGYESFPDLDDFFFGLAMAELQHQTGYDTYSTLTEFGGITMLKYILATAFFLGLALRHERSAEALIEKSPEIRLRDILTVTADKPELETSVLEALNLYGPTFSGFTPVTKGEVATILSVLSVRRDNLGVLSTTMAPVPFLVELSETAWITSVAGVQLGAMTFLLESLRYHFQADYDRNQQTRERSMQRNLKGMLADSMPTLKFVDNVKVRLDGRTVTDIDLAVADERDGSVFLFQLKHQDHYGADVKRRSTRSSRLKKEVGHWLESVRNWLMSVDHHQLASALQMKASFRRSQVYLVVVSRHFAHFLSSANLRDDAVYATWMQFYDAWNRHRHEQPSSGLPELFDILSRYMTHKMARGFEAESIDHYHLRNLSFRIRPASAAESAAAEP